MSKAEIADWLGRNWWVLALPALAFLIFGAVWWLIRRDRLSDRQEDAQLAALPQSAPMPAVPAQAMWSLPEIDGQWSDRG